MCVLAAGLHLCWSGYGFGVRPSAPSCLASHFSTFSYASLLRVLPMIVSHRSGLVAVYDEAGFLGGSHVGVCGSGSCRCTLLEVPIFVCGFFSVAAELCILSSCWGWGRLLLSLFLVCLLSNLPGAPAVFCYVSGSWRPFWGSTPRCLRLADLLLRWGFRVGLGVSCYRYPVTPLWFSTLCQCSSPSSACPSGFCALAGCVSMSDSSLLVYSWGCAGRVCAVPLGFSPMCRALPQGLQRALLSLMQVHWGFSGHRVSVLLLPW